MEELRSFDFLMKHRPELVLISDDTLDKNGKGDGCSLPKQISHTVDYELSDVRIGEKSIRGYGILVDENDGIALKYAEYLRDNIVSKTGFTLEIVYGSETFENLIVVGETNLKDSPISAVEEYLFFEEDGNLYLFYGDGQSAEMCCIDLLTKIIGTESEGYDGYFSVDVVKGARSFGKWSVLSRFGDNIDDGYTIPYQSDYTLYREDTVPLSGYGEPVQTFAE